MSPCHHAVILFVFDGQIYCTTAMEYAFIIQFILYFCSLNLSGQIWFSRSNAKVGQKMSDDCTTIIISSALVRTYVCVRMIP